MKKSTSPPYQFETTAVHAGLQPDPSTGAIITPIYQTATFALAEDAEQQQYEYARVDNPTRTSLQHPLTHAAAAASPLAVDPALIRLSIGIENPADLINDLAAPLRQ